VPFERRAAAVPGSNVMGRRPQGEATPQAAAAACRPVMTTLRLTQSSRGAGGGMSGLHDRFEKHFPYAVGASVQHLRLLVSWTAC